ncbi:MAG: uracil phosphoribosyltransferase [Oligoflexales bacterium]|nr:uracil phosphoribosyltransferase [Oligoflexales bacterium]
MAQVNEIQHPLIQHKLTLMRKKDTSTGKFRTLMREISMLLGYEVSRDMVLSTEKIETPIAPMEAPVLAKKKMALISILRAGQGIIDGMLQLMPTARVGHIGLYRDAQASNIIEYYFKVPEDISSRDVLVVDPMLATGKSAVAAVSRIKEVSPKSIKFVCLLAAPEGIEYFHKYHSDVAIFTAAVDQGLNEKKYIVPGIGDAGDRLFGTM